MSHTIVQENDNTYLNVVFDHKASDGVNPSLAVYNVTKTAPILDKANDYYCSVIRFAIPILSIPLAVIPIIPNQGNPNLTPLTISIIYGGITYLQNIIYVSNQPYYPTPVQNIPTQVITPYYYLYSFQNFIDSINTALTAAFNAFAIVNPTAPQVTGSLPTPYFYFDPTTQLINLVVSSAWATTGGTQALIVINSSALSFLSSFDFLSLSGDQFAFVIQNNGNNGYALYGTSPTNPPSFLKFTQEYDSMSNWISLRKIILSTNAMPVISEAVPAYSATGEQTGVYNSFPILTDFIPEINSAADSRGIAYYTPTSQYRLIDLTNNQPLSKIDLKIYWEDKLGNLYDLYIPQYQQATVKIAFVRKSLYKQSPLLYK